MSSMPGFSSYLLSILLVMLLSCSDSSGHQSECFITPTLARPSRSEGLQLRWTSSRAGRLGVLHLYAAESSSSSRSRLTADQQAETTSGRLRNLKRLIESSWSNDTPSDKFLGSRRLGKMKRIVLNQVGSQETSSSESRENALVVDERLQSIEVMIGERRHSAPNKTAGDLVVELVLEAADMAAVTAWGSARLLS
mmetsp:Transcript_2775/g.9327  ORF Transcript_2775/g.9327 Transcript_2775/m.9327 type:complete len:195 (+) Transcript_2775:180-764(+)